MTRAQHTPEPWHAPHEDSPYWIQGQGVPLSSELGHGITRVRNANLPLGNANAARIVACINGCAGLDPAAYAGLVETAGEFLADHERTSTPEKRTLVFSALRAALERVKGDK